MAVKSNNQLNAKINKNFVIRVLENPKQNKTKNTRLVSANGLSKFDLDEKLKIRLFDKVLKGHKFKYTFLIRKRLKIDFHAK